MEIRLSSDPDYHQIMQADACVSSNAPSLGSSEELGHSLFDFVVVVFSWGGSQREGSINPDTGILPCANKMGKHAFQTHFDEKEYTNDNIYACEYISMMGLKLTHLGKRGRNDSLQTQICFTLLRGTNPISPYSLTSIWFTAKIRWKPR